MMRCLTLIVIVLLRSGSAFGAEPSTQPANNATVVWISIDGFRGDYLARFKPPFLSRLAAEGAYTTQLKPTFPSLTFPNHVSQVTGTTVAGHGIPSNIFYDASRKQTYNFPNYGSVLRAEPIWTTAKRQGVRVAVFDWPISQGQRGRFAADYAPERFDARQTDQQRLEGVSRVLTEDQNDTAPLRLIMTYCAKVDTTGHRYGPDSPQIEQAVIETDAIVGRFVASVIKWFDATHRPADELYLLFTTDHGMETVRTAVNLDLLIGAPLLEGARIITSGPLASIHLIDVPAEQRSKRISQIIAKLQGRPYLNAWPAEKVPAELHYTDESRIGEIVALLSPGYTFTTRRLAATQPAVAGALAAHGYDPQAAPNMLGAAIIWRYRVRLPGGTDLGPIDNTRWHATVARWLGIEPSPDSNTRFIELPAPEPKR